MPHWNSLALLRALAMRSMISSIVEHLRAVSRCKRAKQTAKIGQVIQAQHDARNLTKQAAWPKRRPDSVTPSLVLVLVQLNVATLEGIHLGRCRRDLRAEREEKTDFSRVKSASSST